MSAPDGSDEESLRIILETDPVVREFRDRSQRMVAELPDDMARERLLLLAHRAQEMAALIRRPAPLRGQA